jgi:pyridoxamine 5'-phosphate oxidase
MNDLDPPLRDLLRRLPVLADVTDEPLDLDALGAQPLVALRVWLLEAVAAGEPEPHVMTLSTVSAAGVPSSRVLLCKDVDDDAVYFATSSLSRKGKEIAATELAAVSFYWKATGRQVRLVGTVIRQPDEVGAADFAARGRDSQLAALVHEHGRRPSSLQEVRGLRERLESRHADVVPAPADWCVYALRPHEVELWQGRRDRLHSRLLYERGRVGWTRALLWP